MATPAAQLRSVHTSIANIVANELAAQSTLADPRIIINNQLECGCIGTCTCGVKPKISEIIAPPDTGEGMIMDVFAGNFSTEDVSESIPNNTNSEANNAPQIEGTNTDSIDEPQQLLSGKLECGCVGICNCHEKPKLQEIVDPTKIEGEIIVDAFASDGFQVNAPLETKQKVDIENVISDMTTGVENDTKPNELSQISTLSEEQPVNNQQQAPTTPEIPEAAKVIENIDTIIRSQQNPLDYYLNTESPELKPTESSTKNPGEIAVELKLNDLQNLFAEKIGNQSTDNQDLPPRVEEKIPEAINVSVREQSENIAQDTPVRPSDTTEVQPYKAQPTEQQVIPSLSSENAMTTQEQVNRDVVKKETASKSDPSVNIEKTTAPEDIKAQPSTNNSSETKSGTVQTSEYSTKASTLSESSNRSPDKIQEQSNKAQVASIDSSSIKTSKVADQVVRVIEKLSLSPSVSPSTDAQTLRKSQTPLSQVTEQLKATTSKIEKLITPNQAIESLINRQVASQVTRATTQNNAQQILLRMINAVSQNNKTDPNSIQNNRKISNPTEATVQKDLRTSTSNTISTGKFLTQIKTVDTLINQPQIQARIKELDFILTRVKELSENITKKESVLVKNSNEPAPVTEKINQELILLKTQHAQLRALQAQLLQEFESLIKSQCNALLDSDEDFITMAESDQIFEGRTTKRRRLTRQTQNPSDAKSIIKKNLEREAKRKKAQVDEQVSSQVIITSSKMSGALTSATPKQGVSRGPSTSLQGAFHGESRNGFII